MKPYDAIPGPPGWPILGDLPRFLKFNDEGGTNSLGMHTELYKTLGPIYKLNLAGMEQVVVGSPEFDKVRTSTWLEREQSSPTRNNKTTQNTQQNLDKEHALKMALGTELGGSCPFGLNF